MNRSIFAIALIALFSLSVAAQSNTVPRVIEFGWCEGTDPADFEVFSERITRRPMALGREPRYSASQSASSSLSRGFYYFFALVNPTGRTINVFEVEYEFQDTINPGYRTVHRFRLFETIPPGAKREMVIFSKRPPTDVVSVDRMTKKNARAYRELARISDWRTRE